MQNDKKYLLKDRLPPFSPDHGPVGFDANLSPYDYFEKFVSEEDNSLFDIIVEESNRYATTTLHANDPTPQGRGNNWKPVSKQEISAFFFFGLMLAMEIVRKPSYASYWANGNRNVLTYTPNFSLIMSRNRFQEILRFLHCNDNGLAVERDQAGYDPLHKVANIIEFFNRTFEENYRYKVVLDLMRPYFGNQHHVTIDSWFTSPKLVHDLRNRGTYCTGTVITTRKGMPQSFRKAKLPKGRILAKSQGPVMSVLYSDRRQVSLLTTTGSANYLNAYICYKNTFVVQKKMDHLTFQQEIVQGLIGQHREGQTRPGRRSLFQSIRLTARHFIEWIPNKRRMRCAVCSGKQNRFSGTRIRTWCPDCGVGPCVGRCFKHFHTLQIYEE
ncbi:unnamed protein product [Mytilus coruscus]|uniref:PiggyBac transposable element-derived protein domain-containing protein n=1 Tax=Mytilus coruscus TaxID=42192 RepID=A0A6J8BCI2_MYTCO|nr:unnamed protein product [Mytilus coruscus]